MNRRAVIKKLLFGILSAYGGFKFLEDIGQQLGWLRHPGEQMQQLVNEAQRRAAESGRVAAEAQRLTEQAQRWAEESRLEAVEIRQAANEQLLPLVASHDDIAATRGFSNLARRHSWLQSEARCSVGLIRYQETDRWYVKGSCFVLDSNTIVFSAHQATLIPEIFEIEFYPSPRDVRRLTARKTAVYNSADVAFATPQTSLNMRSNGIKPARWPKNGSSYRVGDPAILVGFPTVVQRLYAAEGPISDTQLGNECLTLANTTSFTGNSGGPVFSKEGQLIGMLVRSNDLPSRRPTSQFVSLRTILELYQATFPERARKAGVDLPLLQRPDNCQFQGLPVSEERPIALPPRGRRAMLFLGNLANYG